MSKPLGRLSTAVSPTVDKFIKDDDVDEDEREAEAVATVYANEMARRRRPKR